jgi:hypothetical protein
MGADKNSSPKRELGLCPKFTTKDSHTSLSRSCSHNRPTNPRNRPQLNPTRKNNSKSKGHRQSGKYLADCPQCPGGLSVRRVRNCPRGGHGPFENATWTFSTAPRKTDRPWWTRGPSASSLLTVYFGTPSMFITLWFGFDYGTNPPLGTLII